MHHLTRAFYLIVCCAAGLLAWSAAVQATSGTVEVDLVFPQNDSYAPAPIIPVAFAFQHSGLAGYLQSTISFTIDPYGNFSSGVAPVAFGDYPMTWDNFASGDPYMQYGAALEVLNTDGTWLLQWRLDISHCSGSGALNITRSSMRNQVVTVVFTTKNGAKKPDLTAAAQQDTCSNGQGFTFTINDTRFSGNAFRNGKPCAVLAETTVTTPAPTPCGVKIDASAASSVSASLTHRACRLQTPTWCPPSEKNAANSLEVSPLVVGGVACLAAALGGVGFFKLLAIA